MVILQTMGWFLENPNHGYYYNQHSHRLVHTCRKSPSLNWSYNNTTRWKANKVFSLLSVSVSECVCVCVCVCVCGWARWLVICVKPPSQPPGPLSHLLLPVSSPSALWGSFSWLQRRACVSPHAACWPLTLYTSLSRLSVSFYMFYAQWMTPTSSALYWCVCVRDSPYFNLIHSQTSKVRKAEATTVWQRTFFISVDCALICWRYGYYTV